MNQPRLKDLPARSVDLIDQLDKLYPHMCIREGETLESAHRRAGCRELIDLLLDLRRLSEDRAARVNREVLNRGT